MRQAKAAPAPARVDYPSNRLANVHDLKVNEPLNVSYPDKDAPGVLIKLGTRVPGGAGPDGDIVGFSTTCPHKGFPLSYNRSDVPALLPLRLRGGGQQIWGQATQKPPAVRTACAYGQMSYSRQRNTQLSGSRGTRQERILGAANADSRNQRPAMGAKANTMAMSLSTNWFSVKCGSPSDGCAVVRSCRW